VVPSYISERQILNVFEGVLGGPFPNAKPGSLDSYSHYIVGTPLKEKIDWISKLQSSASPTATLVFALDSWVNASRYLDFKPSLIWTWDDFACRAANSIYPFSAVERFKGYYVESVVSRADSNLYQQEKTTHLLILAARPSEEYIDDGQRHGPTCTCDFVLNWVIQKNGGVVYRQHPGLSYDECFMRIKELGLVENGSVTVSGSTLATDLSSAKIVLGAPSYSLFISSQIPSLTTYSSCRTSPEVWRGPEFTIHPEIQNQ
jgi:hypothetical protein